MISPMTIKTRNRLIIFFAFVSLFLLVGMGILFLISLLSNNIFKPVEHNITFFQNFILTKFNFFSIVISIFVLLIYVFFTFLYINYEFEKTQSTEVIYFSLFLIGCLTESFRLFIPCLNLWDSFSQYVSICSRIVFFGKLLIPFSFVFMSTCNGVEYRQDVERNISILIISAAIIACIIPLNSNNILPLCFIEFGYFNIFLILWITLILVTLISLFRNDYISDSKTKMPLGFFLISIGYLTLCFTVNYLLLSIGTILIISGTLIYLRALHKQYLWD